MSKGLRSVIPNGQVFMPFVPCPLHLPGRRLRLSKAMSSKSLIYLYGGWNGFVWSLFDTFLQQPSISANLCVNAITVRTSDDYLSLVWSQYREHRNFMVRFVLSRGGMFANWKYDKYSLRWNTIASWHSSIQAITCAIAWERGLQQTTCTSGFLTDYGVSTLHPIPWTLHLGACQFVNGHCWPGMKGRYSPYFFPRHPNLVPVELEYQRIMGGSDNFWMNCMPTGQYTKTVIKIIQILWISSLMLSIAENGLYVILARCSLESVRKRWICKRK